MRKITYLFAAVAAVGSLLVTIFPAAAQQTVQLPSFTVFSVQTTVIVPDGGSMLMSSLGRAAMGETIRGVPILGSAPMGSRLFRNRGIGSETSATNSAVSVQIIRMSELEPEILAEGNRRIEANPLRTTEPIQRKADFISRNVGTRRR